MKVSTSRLHSVYVFHFFFFLREPPLNWYFGVNLTSNARLKVEVFFFFKCIINTNDLWAFAIKFEEHKRYCEQIIE